MSKIRLDIALPTARVSGAPLAPDTVTCVVLADGTEIGRTAAGETSWIGEAPEGSHSFTVVAQDAAGLTAEPSPAVSFDVAVTPPPVDPPLPATITAIAQA